MSRRPNIKTQKVFVTVLEFENWLSKKKTDYNYEFIDGQAIKKQPMKQNEFQIIDFLIRLFIKTAQYNQGDNLLTEADTYIDEYRKRIPDLAYFTSQQIKDARNGTKVVPAFVIELLSDSESFNDVEIKIQDYFKAGVQNVWYINPKTQTIHSYTSAKTVTIHAGSDECHAAPSVPDFRFIVQDLFA
jgi:Uma2 family endonuclease